MIVKDSMVLIHLAKLTLLEKACSYFKEILIPDLVFDEIKKGKVHGFEDAVLIINLVESKKICVFTINNKNLIKKANEFNIQHGEAEALALYWGKKAHLLATDDDNIRKKKDLLEIKIIGTPAIILRMFKTKMIDKNKAKQSIGRLREIGWFHSALLDKLQMEVEK